MLSGASTVTHCGSQQAVLVLFARDMNLYFCCSKSKMWIPAGARIGHNDAAARIGGDAVRPHQAVELRLAGHEVQHLLEEGPLGLHFTRGVKAAFVGELAAVQQRHFRRRRFRGYRLFFFFRRRHP